MSSDKKNDKKKGAPKPEPTEAELKRKGFTDEQIKDLLAKRAMGADEKAKCHAEQKAPLRCREGMQNQKW